MTISSNSYSSISNASSASVEIVTPIQTLINDDFKTQQLERLRNLSAAIFNGDSATSILDSVTRLDSEAKERFLHHASEHANSSVTKDNLTDSKSALMWALSEEVSRYVSLTHRFTQNEWNHLDYCIYEADGSRSHEAEFGKYHRIDQGFDSFMAQVEKVITSRNH
ncbi:MAG: hypothetical protein KBC64_01060 [Simkaniaceae bacterium]|nr:hypothetical protein [Simkaniaceae bacterium]